MGERLRTLSMSSAWERKGMSLVTVVERSVREMGPVGQPTGEGDQRQQLQESSRDSEKLP